MNKYETIFILKENEEKEKSINNILEFITTEATAKKIELIGHKKLAYDVKGEEVGYYVLIEFEVNINEKPGILKSLELRYMKDDNILKYITINITNEEEESDFYNEEDEDEDGIIYNVNGTPIK